MDAVRARGGHKGERTAQEPSSSMDTVGLTAVSSVRDAKSAVDTRATAALGRGLPPAAAAAAAASGGSGAKRRRRRPMCSSVRRTVGPR
eukprot:6095716-Prymnesium_polylepis.1